MLIGIAFDLKEDFTVPAGREDLLEEYDSIDTVRSIRAELEAAGHEVALLKGGEACVRNLLARRVDLVFNIAEGRGGRSREAQVPALCEMLGVPCTHSDALALALTLDKHLATQAVAAAGLPVPFQRVVRSAADVAALDVALPVVLKPLHEGSSMGVLNDSLVRDRERLARMAGRLLDLYRQPVLVEEFLPGMEITVGVWRNDPPRVIGCMEIAPNDVPLDRFLYSIETKRDYKRLVTYHCPPRGLPPATLAEVERIALAAFGVFGCVDVARVDLRLDGAGRPRFLEINPLPGLSPVYSDLCIMGSQVGLPFHDLVLGIVGAAAARHGLTA